MRAPAFFSLSVLLSVAARFVIGQSAWRPLALLFLLLRLRLRLLLLLLLTLDSLRRLSLLVRHLHLCFRSLRWWLRSGNARLLLRFRSLRRWLRSGNARLLLRFRSLRRWLRSHRARLRLRSCSLWRGLWSHRARLRLCSRRWRRRFLWRLLLGRGSYITASWSGLRLRLWLIDAPSRLYVVANAFTLCLLRRHALSALLRRRLFALLLLRLSLLLLQLLHLLSRYSVATCGFP